MRAPAVVDAGPTVAGVRQLQRCGEARDAGRRVQAHSGRTMATAVTRSLAVLMGWVTPGPRAAVTAA